MDGTTGCEGCRERNREIEQVRGEVERLRQQLEQLQKQFEQQQQTTESQQRAGNRQAAKFRRRKHVKNPQSPGRKKGTAATHRKTPMKVDREVDVPVGLCSECDLPAVDNVYHQQFQTDIPPVEPVTTQFNVPVGNCARCGARIQGRHPDQTSDALGAAANQLGPRAHALGFQLKHDFGMSVAKVSRFLLDNFRLSCAASTFIRSAQRFVHKAEPSYDGLLDLLRGEHVVHADETGWRIGRVNAWLWVFSSPDVTIYRIDRSRGHEVPQMILGTDFEGVLISDGAATYDPLPYLSGRCVGHILARISKLKEARPEPSHLEFDWLSEILQDAMHLGSRRFELTPTGYGRLLRKAERNLDQWIDSNEFHEDADIRRLAKHLKQHRHEWFMFLYDSAVPPTNNHAERMIRPAVILRKLCGCNKTDAGAVVHSVMASLLVSCRQQGKRFAEFADRLFHMRDPTEISLAALRSG